MTLSFGNPTDIMSPTPLIFKFTSSKLLTPSISCEPIRDQTPDEFISYTSIDEVCGFNTTILSPLLFILTLVEYDE